MTHYLYIDTDRGYWANIVYVLYNFYAEFWMDIVELIHGKGVFRNEYRTIRYLMCSIQFSLLPILWLAPLAVVNIEYCFLGMDWTGYVWHTSKKAVKEWWLKTIIRWYLTRYLEAGHFEGKITTKPVELSVGGRIIVPHRPPAEEFWNAQELPMDIRILISDAL